MTALADYGARPRFISDTVTSPKTERFFVPFLMGRVRGFKLGNSTLVFHDPPPQAGEVINDLDDILKLQPNWDSYGAPRIRSEVAHEVIRFVVGSFSKDTPTPQVVPTSEGGVQLEWHLGRYNLELDFMEPSRVQLFFEDRATREELEMDLTSDLNAAVDAVARLTQ